MPQLYPPQTVGAPQLAAFKALYARNQGGIAAPAGTLDTKTQAPQTAGENATPPTTTPPTTLLPPSTVHPATLPGPSIPPPSLMSPYQFHTAQVPYVPMNHPLVLCCNTASTDSTATYSTATESSQFSEANVQQCRVTYSTDTYDDVSTDTFVSTDSYDVSTKEQFCFSGRRED